ncbi:hypothetical protein BKA93DRAFT_760198 [Sparassis latifolia]
MDDCIEACCFMCFSSTDWCCFNQPCGLRGFRSPEYDEVGNGPRGVRGKGKDADAGDQMNRQPARAQGMLVDRKGGLAAGAQPPVVGRTSDQISRPSVAFDNLLCDITLQNLILRTYFWVLVSCYLRLHGQALRLFHDPDMTAMICDDPSSTSEYLLNM